MEPIDITTTQMGFHLNIDSQGKVKGSGISIARYMQQFEHRSWDNNKRQWDLVNTFYHHDMDRGIIYFPKYDLNNFTNALDQNRIPYRIIEVPPTQGELSHFQMMHWVTYKNEKQRGAVEFLTNKENGPLRGLALQTGAGKSVSAIWALQKIGIRPMITMTSRLEQWVSEIVKYTSLEEDDIYVVSGVGSLTKLFTQIDKQIFPKIILASTKTVRLYLDYGPTYQHLPPPDDMCEKLGIGIVATDEMHEHFYSNFLMGIMLNPALFIPITATFVANDPYVKKIFDQFLPKHIQFTGGDYDKFVEVVAYSYTGGGHQLKPFHYMRPKGYSQIKFEESLLGRLRRVLDTLVVDAFIPIIKEHYIDIAEPGEKFLFLCATKELCDHLEGVFRRAFSGKTVSVFYSGKPVTVLDKFDMIISTPGSAGTGRDIKGLRTCFVFESTASETRNRQFIGRLRGPPQMMNTPVFVYLSFSAIPKHVLYAQGRAFMYGELGRTFKHRTIS